MDHKELQKKQFFANEIEQQKRLFKKEPVRAITAFLECYDSQDKQIFEIPHHVNEFLADCFQSFMYSNHATLDKAFGGRTASQRNSIVQEERNYGIVFDVIATREDARKQKQKERAGSTPFEFAVAKVAKKYGLADDTIREIYKNSK